jgi:hypothetical protein
MSYEHKTYRSLWENIPNPGSKIRAPQGTFILAGVDVHAEAVKIYTPDRNEILVPVNRFKEFRNTVMEGNTWESEPEINKAKEMPTATKISSVKKALPNLSDTTDSERKGTKRRPPRPARENVKKAGQEDKISTPPETESASKRNPRRRKRRKKKPSETSGTAERRPETKPQSPPVGADKETVTDDKGTTRKRPSKRRKRRRSPKPSSDSKNLTEGKSSNTASTETQHSPKREEA